MIKIKLVAKKSSLSDEQTRQKLRALMHELRQYDIDTEQGEVVAIGVIDYVETGSRWHKLSFGAVSTSDTPTEIVQLSETQPIEVFMLGESAEDRRLREWFKS